MLANNVCVRVCVCVCMCVSVCLSPFLLLAPLTVNSTWAISKPFPRIALNTHFFMILNLDRLVLFSDIE